MKNPIFMARRSGFTLLETVIAIGVLAVLLTGFMVVFAPAAAGIKRSISVQEADRLASTLEEGLVTLRGKEERDEFATGFGKAFEWIRDSSNQGDAVLIYQYRGKVSRFRPDGTPEPEKDINGKTAGEDFVVQTMVRRIGDDDFEDDLEALEGGVYLVKCTQLIFVNGELRPGTAGRIVDPKGTNPPAPNADDYPEAVIAFSAAFHTLPARSQSFFDSNAFGRAFTNAKNPVFTRNLAVRR